MENRVEQDGILAKAILQGLKGSPDWIRARLASKDHFKREAAEEALAAYILNRVKLVEAPSYYDDYAGRLI